MITVYRCLREERREKKEKRKFTGVEAFL